MSIKELQKEYEDSWAVNKPEILEKLLSLGFKEFDEQTKQWPILVIKRGVISGRDKRPTKTEKKIFNLNSELKMEDDFLVRKG